MATPYSNHSTHQKPCNNVLLVIFTCFFLFLIINVNSARAVSFNFAEFTDDGSLTLQGDAEIWEDGSLALPADPSLQWTTSRVLYAKPVPIWDSTTGNVASFVTSFSFAIKDFEKFNPADGLVFFLAPFGTEIPNNSTGANFGIVQSSTAYNPFVGVEFDTFINPRDPKYRHIGIDVNSFISIKTVKWDRVSGSLEKVSIIYDSLTKTLNVVVAHQNGEISTIAQIVDLKAVLPENVSVGFSATTSSGSRERHDLYSWSFSSTLNTNNPIAMHDSVH